ncbi:hypothetical protein HanRHA438_Chr16g0755141 [Helianthus annuus]|nr:hypothetical protein HanRHA438_Chr16g0755141 [Helianthus annuus]
MKLHSSGFTKGCKAPLTHTHTSARGMGFWAQCGVLCTSHHRELLESHLCIFKACSKALGHV